jgi:hypothetical protein
VSVYTVLTIGQTIFTEESGEAFDKDGDISLAVILDLYVC